MGTERFTIGVEEEFLVVDGETGVLRPDGPALLPAAREQVGKDVHPELHSSQLEVNTDRRKRFTYGLYTSYYTNVSGGRSFNLNPRISMRPSPALRKKQGLSVTS